MPTVSIMSPCHNVEKYLEETIESVIHQTYKDWEYIIIDDGSTDGSAIVASRFADLDHRISLVRQMNAGAPAARGTGFRASHPKSRYLLWLDGDDLLEPTMLEELVNYLDENERVGLVFCNRQHIDEASRIIMSDWQPTRWVPGRFLPQRLDETTAETPFSSIFAQDAVMNPTSSLIRRATYVQTRGWDETFGQPFEDWDLFFQIALVSQVHYVPSRLVRYRMGRPGQSTGNVEGGRRQYLKLYSRWSRYEALPPDKAATVQAAIHFREGRVLPMQHLLWGVDQLQKRQLQSAAWCFARSARCIAVYALNCWNGAYEPRFAERTQATHG